jgi:hypothetical protein
MIRPRLVCFFTTSSICSGFIGPLLRPLSSSPRARSTYRYSSQRQIPPSGLGYRQVSRLAQFLHNPIQVFRSFSAAINPALDGVYPSVEILSGARPSPINSSHCQIGLAESRGNVHSAACRHVRQSPEKILSPDMIFSSWFFLSAGLADDRGRVKTIKPRLQCLKAKGVPIGKGRGLSLPGKPGRWHNVLIIKKNS